MKVVSSEEMKIDRVIGLTLYAFHFSATLINRCLSLLSLSIALLRFSFPPRRRNWKLMKFTKRGAHTLDNLLHNTSMSDLKINVLYVNSDMVRPSSFHETEKHAKRA